MKILVSLSSANYVKEKALVARFKKAGCEPHRIENPGALEYECKNWSLQTLKKILETSGWKSQGKKFFPDSEGAYLIERIGGDELAAITPDANGVFYLEFSGY